jgi:hypothetical protein
MRERFEKETLEQAFLFEGPYKRQKGGTAPTISMRRLGEKFNDGRKAAV